MGFFFSKAKAEPKPRSAGPRRSNNTTPKQRQSAPSLNRLACKVCPLANRGNKVEPHVPKKGADIYFLGEKPSAADVKNGKPFTDKTGRLLKDLIPDEFDSRVGYGLIVQHRTPNDRQPDWNEIECCRLFTVSAVEKARPKLIVGLGITTLQWMLGSVDMKGLRGRVFAVQVGEHKCFFMPTFGPDYIIKNSYDEDKPLQWRLGHAFRMDVAKAFEIVDNLHEPKIVTPVEAKQDIDIFYNRDFDKLLDYLRRAHKSKRIALDYEAYPIRPFHKESTLLTASISFKEKGKLKTFAFALNHPKQGWSNKQLKEIKEKFGIIMQDPEVFKIAQNASVELEWSIFLYGMDKIIQHDSWDDTMMQAHVIDERKGDGREEERRPTYQSLGFLTRQHIGINIKKLFKLNKKDMRTSEIEECLLYNGVDSKHTYILYDIQNKILKRENLLDVYKLSRPRQVTVSAMQYLGIPVDQKVNAKIASKLGKSIEKIETKINNMDVIKAYNADHKEPFNPYSQPNVVNVFQNYVKANLSVDVKTHDMIFDKPSKDKERFKENNVTSRIAVDKGVLQGIKHPLAPAIIRLRNRSKLKSTYVDGFTLGKGETIWDDGLLHTSFNTTFTTSARLSSDDPNCQNFPKRDDKWIREQIKPPKGKLIVSIDYGQLEWCGACIECKDQVMVNATWTGYDVHMVWTEKLARKWPTLVGGKSGLKDKDKLKYARSVIKNKMIFPLIFGAQDTSIATYITTAIGTELPKKIANEFFEEFWDEFKGLGKWQKDLMKGYYNNGYVPNKLGRRRRYPMNKNEAINYPIQSLGAEIVINAMDRISRLAIESGEMYLHPRLNIHDDLTFFIDDDDKLVDETINILAEEMLKLPYDFINVPMSVEVSVGYDWANMDEIIKINTLDIGRHTEKDRKKYTR